MIDAILCEVEASADLRNEEVLQALFVQLETPKAVMPELRSHGIWTKIRKGRLEPGDVYEERGSWASDRYAFTWMHQVISLTTCEELSQAHGKEIVGYHFERPYREDVVRMLDGAELLHPGDKLTSLGSHNDKILHDVHMHYLTSENALHDMTPVTDYGHDLNWYQLDGAARGITCTLVAYRYAAYHRRQWLDGE